MMEIIKHYDYCRVCSDRSCREVFALTHTPLEDQYVDHQQLLLPQPVYPLTVSICLKCGYVHLPYIIDPVASYTRYIYNSSVTVGLRKHYDMYAAQVTERFSIPKGSFVVDLGSNDGSMLASFQSLGMEILGVEPARAIAEKANLCGYPTVPSFFTSEVVEEIKERYRPAKVVTANYMYANILDVKEFTLNVVKIMDDDGIFVVQTGYHPTQFETMMFDYIYHEHYSYFSVEVLQHVFYACGLEVIFVEEVSQKGGSIRVVGQLQGGSRNKSASVAEKVGVEQIMGIRTFNYFYSFERRVYEIRSKLLEQLRLIKDTGNRIIGFGASHSTTTLLYNFDLHEYFEYLVDDNGAKQGLYSPGYHLPVFSTDRMYVDKPDYVVILAWQHRQTIMKRHELYTENGGRWILPLPDVEII